MKQILAAAMLMASCLFVLSCQQEREAKHLSGVIDTAAIKASIDSVGAVVQKAHDTGDEKLLAMTWAKDGIFSMAGNPPVFGRAAIVAAIRNIPPPPPGAIMSMNPINITVLSAESAFVFGIDSMKYTPAGTTKQVVETSTFFVLAKKTSEGWQTFREILSPN